MQSPACGRFRDTANAFASGVVLHNDDFNTMSYVVTCLINAVPGMSEERATEIMVEAHTHGQARVVTCPLELAELYRDRLESLLLTATIERA